MKRYKYPRTPHLPTSPGYTGDDLHTLNYNNFTGKEVVITEKLDGENSTFYSDGYFHARSIDGRSHPSRSWTINELSKINLPSGLRICGENVYAQHSIAYNDLETYFFVYSVWEGDKCWGWSSVELLCQEVDLCTVPVLYKGKFDQKILENAIKSLDNRRQEGIVIRNANSFDYDDFFNNVAKWVRQNHVQSSEHWMHQKLIKNKLKS